MQRHIAWLTQSKNDFKWGEDSLKAGHFAQVCFIAQQVAEKSLKAIAFYRNYDVVKSHSLVHIAKDLKINGELEGFGRELDLYYLASRYPDALPDHAVPSDSFDIRQATRALTMAKVFILAAEKELQVRSE